MVQSSSALRAVVVFLVLLVTASAWTTETLPRRLIVGIDGVGFADMVAAQSAGAFRQFFPVSRMVSTFPSISDIAWSEIFRTPAPPGYQRVYYKLDAGKTVGGPIDPIRPIEFEKRMHLGFEQKAHHVSSYMTPGRAARSELTTLTQTFFKSRGIETFYAYLPAPDALQHVRGDVTRYLQALDAAMTRMLVEYRQRTGMDLELVLVSDHGNNRRWQAENLDLAQFLKNRGYSPSEKIAGPKDVVFSTDGVTTGVGVFARPSEVSALAVELSTLQGIELVTWVPRDASDYVGVRAANGQVATVRRRANGDLAYEPVTGDPLGYTPLVSRLAGAGRLVDAGFASAADWLDVSKDHQYPAALQRIMRGHHDVTMNPAPILLSVMDGYQVANGVAAFFNQLRPLGGTHGGLNAANSLGILMSTYRPTVDTVSTDVAAQFDGFPRMVTTHH